MKRQNNGKYEERQRRCMLMLVRDVLSDKSVEEITYQNKHGAITVRRSTPENGSTHAIGFTADFEEEVIYEEKKRNGKFKSRKRKV